MNAKNEGLPGDCPDTEQKALTPGRAKKTYAFLAENAIKISKFN